MKSKFLIILVALFTISFTFICCDNNTDETDSDFNGTWVSDSDEKEIYFNKGNVTFLIEDEPYMKGTYTTKDNKITVQITEIIYYEGGALVTKDRLFEIFLTTGEIYNPRDIDAMFPSCTNTYFIDGSKLFIFIYDDKDEYEDFIYYTKQ
jgi:hypothetical protein